MFKYKIIQGNKMKVVLLYILLQLGVVVSAQNGLDQSHLVSVTPGAEEKDVDPNAVVSIIFDSEIDVNNLKKKIIVVKHDGTVVEGRTLLSADKKGVVFTPSTSMPMGEQSVEVSALRLAGNEKQPCHGFWNHTKVWMDHHFGWFHSRVCYENVPAMSQPLAYTFNVLDNTADVLLLELLLKGTALAENESAAVTVIAYFDDNSTEDVTDKVVWSSADSDVAEVEHGKVVAHEEGTTELHATYNSTLEQSVTVEVYKSVDGHRLPPEPDEDLNKETLLGIDVNDNGIRDDVERWIYLEMEIQNGYPKIERAIGMQMAGANQIILEDPSNPMDKAVNTVDAAMDCWVWYDYSKKSHQYGAQGRFSRAIDDISFNTLDRLKAYELFNASLSGRIFSSTPVLKTKSQCITDIDAL